MNWIDIAIAVVLLFSIAGAVRNGITRELIRIAALMLGVVGGMWWYEDAALYLKPFIDNEALANLAGFAAIVLGALLAGGLIGRILARMLKKTGLGWADRMLGGAFGLLRGLVMATVIVLAVLAFDPASSTARMVAQSRLAPLVLHAAHAATTIAPSKLRAEFEQGFERARAVWMEPAGAAPPAAAGPPPPSGG